MVEFSAYSVTDLTATVVSVISSSSTKYLAFVIDNTELYQVKIENVDVCI